MKEKSKFQMRALTSVLAAISFIAITFAGLMLYVAPPGRVANWTNWEILGLAKEQWAALHTCFGCAFILFAIIHIYLNWTVLLNYFKGRVTKKFAIRKEWLIAALVCAAIFFGTLIEVAPFSSIMALNDHVKNSWERPDQRPPIPHAEILPLGALAKKTGFDLNLMISNLRAEGIEFAGPDELIGEIAKANGISPVELYSIATTPLKRGD